MNANNRSIDLTPPSVKEARLKLLRGAQLAVIPLTLLSLLCLLSYFLPYMIAASLAALTLFFSLAIFIHQKRVVIDAVLALVSSFLALASCSVWKYSYNLPHNAQALLISIIAGLFCMGLGIAFIACAIAILGNRFGWASKYNNPRLKMILFVISGIFQFGMGTYSLVTGIQFWEKYHSIMFIH